MGSVSIDPPAREITGSAFAPLKEGGRLARSSRSAPLSAFRLPGRSRQAEIARKLGMGLLCHGPSVSPSWPIVAGRIPTDRHWAAWNEGFPYGIITHLDWVSNTGYQVRHFHYNPAHMIAITFFFTTSLAAGPCMAG